MIKTIIVEDDPIHVAQILDFLEMFKMSIEVVGITASIDDTIREINQKKPNLILLDIQLEGGQTGFDLLKKIDKPDFDIIFTTAHIDKNINEIRLCAVDYIVKPYMYSEVKETLEKYLLSPQNPARLVQLDSLRSNILVGNIDQKAIWIPDRGNLMQIRISQILYCQAEDQYTQFYMFEQNGEVGSLLSSKLLLEWENDLIGYNFCRISRKHLVNMKYVSAYNKIENQVVMTNDTLLSPSKTGKEKLLNMVKM